MDGLKRINQIISVPELKRIVSDLNNLIPDTTVTELITIAHKSAAGWGSRAELLPIDPEKIRDLLTKGEILITVSGDTSISTVGVGTHLCIQSVHSDLLSLNESVRYGFLLIDQDFTGLIHTCKEGNRSFAVLNLAEDE